MRVNRLKEKMLSDETAVGVSVAWPSPEIVEFLGHLGFDWVFIDAQHGYIDRNACAQMVRAAEISDMTPIVRVPENTPAIILNYLETGVLGVVVPFVSTAADARAAVNAVRYGPKGTRSAARGTRISNYGLTHSSAEYYQWANDNLLVYALIETRQGIENIDEILDVEGIDIVGFGPADLSMNLGHEGDTEHPEVKEQMGRAQERIDARKPVNIRHVHASELLASAGRQYLGK